MIIIFNLNSKGMIIDRHSDNSSTLVYRVFKNKRSNLRNKVVLNVLLEVVNFQLIYPKDFVINKSSSVQIQYTVTNFYRGFCSHYILNSYNCKIKQKLEGIYY